tara:strand:+ start:52 stop:273 length:222 start_codon:yes stop_codon:yes gene_type:complete
MARREDLRQVRSLSWLKRNGKNKTDREYAQQIYRKTLFELYARHVSLTGQTYYPPMWDDMMEEYKLLEDAESL